MSDLKELLLNKFKKKDESDEAEKVIEVITKILKAIHLKKYEEIIDYVDESEVDDLNEMFECVEKSLEYNGFGSIDEYGAACNSIHNMSILNYIFMNMIIIAVLLLTTK